MVVAFFRLPGELREKIYRYYFQVEGGYIYDADADKLKTADNHPIELSLLFTCRNVAHEAQHLPLSLNSIQFKTLYKPELNNLAGCFNAVTATYHLLQSELTLLLEQSGVMTRDIHDQLALQFPDFKSRLDFTLPIYQRTVDRESENGRGLLAVETQGEPDPDTKLVRKLRSWMCRKTQEALYINVNISFLSSKYYRGFSRMTRPFNDDTFWWSNSFWKAEGALSSALQLLAQHKREDFEHQIYTNFPHWIWSYSADEFLKLRFEHWAIPSPAQVKHAMKLLAIGDVWELPSMWHEARSCCSRDNSGHLDHHRPHPHLHVDSDVQSREKIRFSAVANAIRFLDTRLSPKQRLNLRSLILLEDLPSVNQPSAHAQGLARFYHENPHLRVERRVDLMGCIYSNLPSPSYVAGRFQSPSAHSEEPQMTGRGFSSRITQWLLDTLAVTDAGIPADAYTLVLQAGSYRDYFTDQFQQQIHTEVAWHKAFKTLNHDYPFDGPVHQYREAIQTSMMDMQEVDAIETLVNGTSPILRSDFNVGVAQEFENIVNDTRHLHMRHWMREWSNAIENPIQQPIHNANYNTRLLQNFEIRTN